VVAVGTSFNVERLGSQVLVTLIRGRVLIRGVAPATARADATRPISLKAGEEFVASQDVQPLVVRANLQNATAWEAGRLVFRNETLAQAVERVNRYTEKSVLVDPSIADLRISGVFNAGDVGAFVSAVTSYFPLQAVVTADDDIMLRRR
jgi:transmembrane sensor